MTEQTRIALHAVVPRTEANGPGIRYGIWVQGCRYHCPGCISPATVDFLPEDAPEFKPPSTPGWVAVETLAGWIAAENERAPIEGISVSGGEPFDQPQALYELLSRVQRMGLGILVFTGHTKEELMGKPETRKFFVPHPLIDVLVDGAYERYRATEGEPRGSANQRVILLTGRYRENDLVPAGPMECVIEPDGSVIYTGFSIPSMPFG